MSAVEIQNVELSQSLIQNIISGLKSNGNPANDYENAKIILSFTCILISDGLSTKILRETKFWYEPTISGGIVI